MLNANPGLRDICHSITGGALAAQGTVSVFSFKMQVYTKIYILTKSLGYWMPYEAAKAVAATFCWKIRYALTPIFGVDFISLCIHPDDPHYGRMIIDPSIVRKATENAKEYLEHENKQTGAGPSVPSPQTPEKQHQNTNGRDAYPSRNRQEGGVMDSEEIGENCTPPTLDSDKGTLANISQSAKPRLPSFRHILEPPPDRWVERPRDIFYGFNASPTPTNISETSRNPSTRDSKVGSDGGYDAEAGSGDVTPSASISGTEHEEVNDDDDDDDGDDRDDEISDVNDHYDNHEEEETLSDDSCSDSEFNREHETRITRDTNAAHTLLKLHMRAVKKPEDKGEDEDAAGRKRRRASN